MTITDLVKFLHDQPLLSLAMAAILLVTLGGMMLSAAPRLGRLLRGAGNIGLTAALLLTIAQVARFTTGTDFALPQIGMPAQTISGGETRIKMARDGHFWITAEINGVPRRFLVDTGATLTAVSESTAATAELAPQPFQGDIVLSTANGSIRAELASIEEMRFGNIVARDLDAVIAPNIGETNVIGMNLLSRLESWRVEGRTMILVPHNPQESDDPA